MQIEGHEIPELSEGHGDGLFYNAGEKRIEAWFGGNPVGYTYTVGMMPEGSIGRWIASAKADYANWKPVILPQAQSPNV